MPYCAGDPCGAHGTCVETADTYICICARGYIGADCHSMCDDKPCYNNSTCTLRADEKGLPFHCSCANGTLGQLCEISKFSDLS